MKISVVIPIFNHYGLLHQTLWDLYKKCSSLHEVIVVNDASIEDSVIAGLAWWKKQNMLPLRVVTNEENMGFLLSSNIGLQEASGGILLLLSNDVRIYKDITREIAIRLCPKTLLGGTLYTKSTGWNKFGNTIFPYVEGYLLAATNDGWKELGYFDEMYAPHDFEDVDLSTTAKSLGYNLWQLPEGMVHHLGSQSIPYGDAREIITKTNREKFRKKWLG